MTTPTSEGGKQVSIAETIMDENWRIGYTVGRGKEIKVRYFDERFTEAEAKRRVAVMRKIDAESGLRGAEIDSNYFCEPAPSGETFRPSAP